MGMVAWPSALCLLTLLQPATQDMVQLNSSSVLYAECGTKVTLKCEVSSPEQGLNVKRMEWSLNGSSLCFVRENRLVNSTNNLKHHICMYSHGYLYLILHSVQPQDAGTSAYVCQLRSNRGVSQTETRVELKELSKCSQSGSPSRGASTQTTRRNGVGSVRPIRILWSISLLLIVLLI